ncbi:hypothetical protein C8J56DRAFT_29449 [Mycena floridula]|nr:hypothetical protein C8J56DRAFT_29449 [Mycena floridula]
MSFPKRPVLLSPVLDTFLGVFTGVLAYYLYENHPRNMGKIAEGEKLPELLRWKWERSEWSERVKPRVPREENE